MTRITSDTVQALELLRRKCEEYEEQIGKLEASVKNLEAAVAARETQLKALLRLIEKDNGDAKPAEKTVAA